MSVRCALFSSHEVFANAVDHHHYESVVIYVQPVAAADEFIIAVSYELTVNILAQVWLLNRAMMFALGFGLVRLPPLEAEDIRDHVI